MSTPFVKFNIEDKKEFFTELRKRVNLHFTDNKISKHANYSMMLKTAFMLSLYFTPLILMVTGTVTGLWPIIGLWAIMGFGMSGIGLSVMHDANHGSYSKNKNVNKVLGFMLNFIGGYHINWIIQHNVLHHSFTNVHGFDEDIDKPMMRFSPNQESKGVFKYQLYYAPFLYGVMTIFWLLAKDFAQLIKYNKMNLLAGQGVTLRKAVMHVIFNKVGYFALFVALPLLTVDLLWWQTILGFLLMHFMSGLILAFVFQPAHVVQETEFFLTDERGSVENNWAVHQVLTTSNYANNSGAFSWFVGGLNHQIEHHLFPNICHVHYKDISPIVKKTALEYGLPYHEHRTFLGALISHFSLLNDLGTGKYDKDLLASQAAKEEAIPSLKAAG
jgi:linoleoyl-CoA desaturase